MKLSCLGAPLLALGLLVSSGLAAPAMSGPRGQTESVRAAEDHGAGWDVRYRKNKNRRWELYAHFATRGDADDAAAQLAKDGYEARVVACK